VYTSASRRKGTVRDDGGNHDAGPYTQVSRLGNPLFNEVIVPISNKYYWNRVSPAGDSQFAKYVESPELAALLPVLYPGVFPNLAGYTKARADLVAILLTGLPPGVIPGFQNYSGPTQADLLRLNVAVPPSASPSPFASSVAIRSASNGRRGRRHRHHRTARRRRSNDPVGRLDLHGRRRREHHHRRLERSDFDHLPRPLPYRYTEERLRGRVPDVVRYERYPYPHARPPHPFTSQRNTRGGAGTSERAFGGPVVVDVGAASVRSWCTSIATGSTTNCTFGQSIDRLVDAPVYGSGTGGSRHLVAAVYPSLPRGQVRNPRS
jgi:hypothetical protein